jgi:hypothetical protein
MLFDILVYVPLCYCTFHVPRTDILFRYVQGEFYAVLRSTQVKSNFRLEKGSEKLYHVQRDLHATPFN